VPEVRLIGEDGKQIGVVKTSQALSYAQERDLDLVEVAPEARPPVVRVLDYSKYKYEQAQKQKAARKHQQQITIREIKFRPKIAQNDYDTKKGHVERFLRGRDKVKVTIMFRGREVTHPERGVALLERLAGELSELAVVEQSPLQDGRNMTMMLAPSKAIMAAAERERQGEQAEHEAPVEAQEEPESAALLGDAAVADASDPSAADAADAAEPSTGDPGVAGDARDAAVPAAPPPRATNGSAEGRQTSPPAQRSRASRV
jgi:translation initiation factor IF-3